MEDIFSTNQKMRKSASLNWRITTGPGLYEIRNMTVLAEGYSSSVII